MSRTPLISLAALVISVAAMAVAITRHENSQAARLSEFAFPPPLNNVQIDDTPAQVRRIMGPPEAVHHYKFPPDLCWDYVFPTATPRYRLCFLNGRLAMRTPF